MPQLTINLSDRAVAGLMDLVRRTNADQAVDLTLEGWVELHLKELAISDELGKRLPALQESEQKDAQKRMEAAVRAERDRLITDLG